MEGHRRDHSDQQESLVLVLCDQPQRMIFPEELNEVTDDSSSVKS